MQKVKIILSYDGSRFDGFAVQKGNANTVSNRLYKVFKSVGIYEKFNAAGRTDKGVHATYQVIDIKIPFFWEKRLDYLKKILNEKLFPSIFIKNMELVCDDFHSRFSAKKRVYRYILSFDDRDPFKAKYVTFLKKKLNKELMQTAIKEFVGIYDFEYFKKSKGGTTNYIREIFDTKYYEYKNYGIFYFCANGFLRSQVRMMVDFLLKIDKSILTIHQLQRQLMKKDIYSRSLAPANGLYLAKVKY